MAALHSPDVAAALIAAANGVSAARGPPPHAALLSSAMRSSQTCASSSAADNPLWESSVFSFCARRSMLLWGGDGSCEDGVAVEQQYAEPSPLLDALLLSRFRAPTWARVPGDSPRRVASAFYLSQNSTACAGRVPLVVQLHFYCDEPQASPADEATAPRPLLGTLRSAPAAKAGDIRFSQPSWLSTAARRSVAHTTEVAVCELEGFVSLPSLCSDRHFDDVGVRRLDDLLRGAYTAGRSGYTDTGSDESALTYGELTAEGMLRLIDALGEASDGEARRRGPQAHPPPSDAAADQGLLAGRHRLRADDVFLDVGSGVGKLVLAASLLTDVKAAVGMEVVRERSDRADAALQHARTTGLISSAEAARVQLLLADATDPAALPQETTLIYLSNLCFPDWLQQAVVSSLLTLPRLRCLGSLRRLEEWLPPAVASEESEESGGTSRGAHGRHDDTPPRACRRLQHVRELHVAVSWDDHARLHVYCCR